MIEAMANGFKTKDDRSQLDGLFFRVDLPKSVAGDRTVRIMEAWDIAMLPIAALIGIAIIFLLSFALWRVSSSATGPFEQGTTEPSSVEGHVDDSGQPTP